MTSNLTSAAVARVGISCSPKYLWATENDRGTTWHSTDITLLRNMLDHLNISLKYVQYDIQKNTTSMILGGEYEL